MVRKLLITLVAPNREPSVENPFHKASLSIDAMLLVPEGGCYLGQVLGRAELVGRARIGGRAG